MVSEDRLPEFDDSGSSVVGVLPAPDPLWAPAFFTSSLYDVSDGPEISDFAASLLRASRGFRAGEPLAFTSWQRWLLDRVFERRADNGFLRYRRALIGVPRKQGKSLLGTSVALQHLLFGPAGAQVYSAASDRQQARIVFGEARQQVWKTARRDGGVFPGDAVTVGFDGSVSGDATGVVIQNVDTGCLAVAKVNRTGSCRDSVYAVWSSRLLFLL